MAMAPLPPWIAGDDSHAVVTVHVQPKASRDRIVGPHGEALKVQVSAPPVDGAANEAVRRLLARHAGVRKKDVTLLSGAGSRRKRFRIDGAGAHSVAGALEAR